MATYGRTSYHSGAFFHRVRSGTNALEKRFLWVGSVGTRSKCRCKFTVFINTNESCVRAQSAHDDCTYVGDWWPRRRVSFVMSSVESRR